VTPDPVPPRKLNFLSVAPGRVLAVRLVACGLSRLVVGIGLRRGERAELKGGPIVEVVAGDSCRRTSRLWARPDRRSWSTSLRLHPIDGHYFIQDYRPGNICISSRHAIPLKVYEAGFRRFQAANNQFEITNESFATANRLFEIGFTAFQRAKTCHSFMRRRVNSCLLLGQLMYIICYF
jgi:hypothetical protein